MMSELSHPPLKITKSYCFDLKLGMVVKKNGTDLTKKTEMDFVE